MRLNGTLETDGDYLILNTEAVDKNDNTTGGIKIKRFNMANNPEDAVLQFDKSLERFTAGVGTNLYIVPLKYVHSQNLASDTWTITHNLNTEDILIQVFDDDGFLVYPDSIQILDKTSVEIKFETPTTGSAVIIG